jgi:hypothetical protein
VHAARTITKKTRRVLSLAQLKEEHQDHGYYNFKLAFSSSANFSKAEAQQ